MDRTGPILDPSLLLQRQLLSKKIGGPAGLMGPQSLVGAPSQSLYEMAALTHEMDTQAVTTKVKEILLANNIGQKVSKTALLRLRKCIFPLSKIFSKYPYCPSSILKNTYWA